MKHTLKKLSLLSLALLTSCTTTKSTEKIYLNEETSLFKCYTVKITNPNEVTQLTYKDENGEDQVLETENCFYKTYDVTITHDSQEESKYHTLDKNDFKLYYAAAMSHIVDAVEDYTWVGQTFAPDTTLNFTIAFKVSNNDKDIVDTGKIEIDFTYSLSDDSTYIQVQERPESNE